MSIYPCGTIETKGGPLPVGIVFVIMEVGINDLWVCGFSCFTRIEGRNNTLAVIAN